jgi:hypothetical protein
MPTHTAVFTEPGPELNPMRARVPTPISVEVFEVLNKQKNPTGKWAAREASHKSEFSQVGRQSSVYLARYGVASLFLKQPEPWLIDGQPQQLAAGFHLHYDPAAGPSLCGSRFHQSLASGLALSLPDVRAGRRRLLPVEWDALCPACMNLMDRTPLPGDHVRVKISGMLGVVMSVSGPAAGTSSEYVVRYSDVPKGAAGTHGTFTREDFSLTMFDKDQPF